MIGPLTFKHPIILFQWKFMHQTCKRVIDIGQRTFYKITVLYYFIKDFNQNRIISVVEVHNFPCLGRIRGDSAVGETQ